MTPNTLREEVLRLSANERLQLVEDIWDSLAADADQLPIPEWHRRELDRRRANPTPEHVTAAELHARLKRRG
jgi:putative addiction module component (TIGR02574 family)